MDFTFSVLVTIRPKLAKRMALRRQQVRTLALTMEAVMVDFRDKVIRVTTIRADGAATSIQQQAAGVKVTIHNNTDSSENKTKFKNMKRNVFHYSHHTPFVTVAGKFSPFFFFFSIFLFPFFVYLDNNKSTY